MNCLVIVNSNLSSTTAAYWNKFSSDIEDRLLEHEVFIPTTRNYRLPSNANDFDAFVLVGSDSFLSCFVNAVYYNLTDSNRQKFIAYIPDRNNSAIAHSLCLPSKLNLLLDLIQKRQTISIDLVRCHFIDKRGIPDSRLVLNDILIGMSTARLPLVFKTVIELAKYPPIFPSKKRVKEISLINNGNSIYRGKYVFAFILLGSKIVKGPRIPYRAKARVNQSGFDYYQLNSHSMINVQFPVMGVDAGIENEKAKYLISGKYQDLIAKAEGEENTIIADGMHLGRLPATFSFLPKALRIVAPMIAVRLNQPVAGKVPATGIPKPIGSRNSLREDNSDP